MKTSDLSIHRSGSAGVPPASILGFAKRAKIPMLLACSVMLAQQLPALARHDFTVHHQRHDGNRMNRGFSNVASVAQEARREARLEQRNLNVGAGGEVHLHRGHDPSHQHARTLSQNLAGNWVRLSSGVDLDLGSSTQNIVLGGSLFENVDAVTIKSGGGEKTLRAGSQVTAAEYVAAKQVLLNGAQAVDLDGSGRAVGGRVDLNSITDRNDRIEADLLVNPQGVTVSGDFGGHSTFRLDGDLTNNGSLFAYSSRHGVRSGTLSADNITNGAGGVISNVVPEAIAKHSALIDLNLHADGIFSNSGTIESTGRLSISAGSEIKNSANIVANGDVSLDAPSLINSGSVTSVSGNLSIDSGVPSTLVVDNSGGNLSAVIGAINLRSDNYTGAYDTGFAGGNLFSREVNMNAGGGAMYLNAEQVSGVVNQKGSETHLLAETDNLILGKICLTGDPTFYNTAGDITLANSITVTQALTIVASGDINFTSNGADITAGDATQGYPITLIAGANIIATAGGANITTLPPLINSGGVTIDGGTAAGGLILFDNVGSVISSRPTIQSGFAQNGGDILLVAFGGTAVGTGRVFTLSGTHRIESGGRGLGNNGNVTVIGPGDDGTFILPGIDTSGGTGSGGNITVTAASPIANNVVYNANGTLLLGGPSIVPANTLAAVGQIRFFGQTNAGNGVLTASADSLIQVDVGKFVNGRQVIFNSNNFVNVFGNISTNDVAIINGSNLKTDNGVSNIGNVSGPTLCSTLPATSAPLTRFRFKWIHRVC